MSKETTTIKWQGYDFGEKNQYVNINRHGIHACYEEATIWGVIKINTINSINVLILRMKHFDIQIEFCSLLYSFLLVIM
jgi:hypothetical protein